MNPSGRASWDVIVLVTLFVLLLFHPAMPLYVDGFWVDSILRLVLDIVPLVVVASTLQLRLHPRTGTLPASSGSPDGIEKTLDGFTATLRKPGLWVPWTLLVTLIAGVSHALALGFTDFTAIPHSGRDTATTAFSESVGYALGVLGLQFMVHEAMRWWRGPTVVSMTGRTLSVDGKTLRMDGGVRIDRDGDLLILVSDREDTEPLALRGHPDDLDAIETQLRALPPVPPDDGVVPEELHRLQRQQQATREP